MNNVVITGGTAGVGRALARHFAANGWDVAVIARDQRRLDATAAEIRAYGRRALAFAADVADPEAMEAAADRVASEWGGIGIWVNSAMTTVYSPFEGMTAEEFKRVNDVVYLGQVNGTRAALKHMRARRAGRIVAIGSALAYRSIPLQSAYCAAKHAVLGFTAALRSELVHERMPISLVMVQLPTVNTPQFSWCRSKLPYEPSAPAPIFSPEAVADAIYEAALGDADEVFVGRSTVKLIAGQTVMPHILDRMVADPAWEQQHSDRPQPSMREGNLFEPVPGDYASRGRFTPSQENAAVGVTSTQLRGGMVLLAGGLAGALALGSAIWARRKN